MGRVTTKPILDTRLNEVEFLDGKVPELTTDVIVEWMHTQCNAKGNEYLLLDLLVDHQKYGKAMSLVD